MLKSIVLAALPLALVAAPPAKSAKRKAAPKPAVSTPAPGQAVDTPVGAPVACTLVIKGEMTRTVPVAQPGTAKGKARGEAKEAEQPESGAAQAKPTPPQHAEATYLETFSYELPGTLQEQKGEGNEVVFRFTPVADLAQKAKGSLTLRQRSGGREATLQGTEITGVPEMRFRAASRGASLYPIAGQVVVRCQGEPLALGDGPRPTSSIFAKRPVVSVVMPDAKSGKLDFAAPYLHFQGNSLWTLKNAQAPFSAAADIVYNESLHGLKLQGKVQITFELDPTKTVQ